MGMVPGEACLGWGGVWASHLPWLGPAPAPSLLLVPLCRSPHCEAAVRPMWLRVTCLAVGFEALQTLRGEALGDTRCVLARASDGGLHPASAICFLAPWLRVSLETWLMGGTKRDAREGPPTPELASQVFPGCPPAFCSASAEGSAASFLLFTKMLQYVLCNKVRS